MKNSSAIAAAAFMCALALAMAHSVALAHLAKEDSDFLVAHNSARRDAHVPKVEWDHRLAKEARDFAARCDRYAVAPFGMNLLWSSYIRDAAGAVDSWVGEKTYCHNRRCYAPHGMTCDHYTQVVADGARQIGCARNVCPGHQGGSTNYYYVCKYDPADGGHQQKCH